MATAGDLLLAHLSEALVRFGTAEIDWRPPRPDPPVHPLARLPAIRCVLPGDLELLVLWSEQYPLCPPFIVATPPGGAPQSLPLDWDLAVPAEDRLARALQRHLVPPPPFQRGFGPRPGRILTRDAAVGSRLGLEATFSGHPVLGEEVERSLFARSEGLLDPALTRRRVLVAGAGSGGSYIANSLCRAGIGEFVLIDGDIVEAANIARTTYEALDIGDAKVEALARQLLRIRPAVRIDARAQSIQDFGSTAELFELIGSVDLVLALTDDPHAQSVLNRLAYGAGTPAIFAGLYAGARGGEVILSLPGETPCYSCSTGYRREGFRDTGLDVERLPDYGTGRLQGEQALGCDIQHLDSVTIKLALGLLCETETASAGRLVRDAVRKQCTYFVTGMVPDYFFFPALFRYGTPQEVPGQYMYQSAWLSPTRNPRCVVCGDQVCDPLQTPIRRGPSR